MLVPDYYPEFRCIGPDCTDSCCHGWRIWFDRDAYHRIKSNRHPEIVPLVKQFVQRVPAEGTQERQRFALIKLDSRARCGFLGDDELCRIQKTIGSNWLPAICNTYPRLAARVGDELEALLKVSCPEVARIVLSRRQPIQFISIADDRNIDESETSRIKLDNDKQSRLLGTIRATCIAILQCRSYDLDARILLLGEFLSGLNEVIAAHRDDLIEELCASVASYLTGERSYGEAAAQYAADTDAKILVVGTALIKLFSEKASPMFKMFLGGCMEGLAIDGNSDIAAMVAGYEAAYARGGKAFLATHSHVFENYLVNLAFARAFPFNRQPYRDVFKAYQHMVLFYGMLKLLAVGIAAHPAGAGEKELVSLIQSFARWAEHAEPEVARMLDALHESGRGDFAVLATAIKEKD